MRPSASTADASVAASEPPSLAKKCLAEAFGTGLIVHGGCGVVCASKFAGSTISPFGIAAVWGSSVALAVYATRDVSGAHLNPAITANLAVNSDFSPALVGPYIAAQTAGAAVAGGVNYLIFRKGISALELKEGIKRGTAASAATYHGAFGMVPNPKLLPAPAALAAEMWMTGVLSFLVMSLTDAEKTVPDGAAPALIGATVASLVAVFGPVTGCGMNPARDLGPRLVTAVTGWGPAAASGWWVYSAGPLAGAVIGGWCYRSMYAK